MKVLIVESEPDLAELWTRHLQRQGVTVEIACSESDAVEVLQDRAIDVIVLDVVLKSGSAFAVADYASYRQPSARVVFVTNSSFFSDGSIFNHIPNACAFLPAGTPPRDLAAVVDHYGAPISVAATGGVGR